MEQLTTSGTDFSQPQRQSAAAIFILVVKSTVSVAKQFWPLLMIFLFRGNNDDDDGGNKSMWKMFFIVGSGAIVGITIALLKYFYYRFHIEEGNLVIQTGAIKKNTLTIPIKNIQAVHLQQNLWQQLFNVVKVSFDSTGSEKMETSIDALSMRKATALKQALMAGEKEMVDVSQHEGLEQQPAKPVAIYRLTAGDIIKLSLSANHLKAFFILVFFTLSMLNDLEEAFDFDSWNVMEKYAPAVQQQLVFAVTFMIILAAIVSVLFSVLLIINKYFNFTLRSEQKQWRINFGLINRQQKIIPHNKIQVFSWEANWLRRKINFWLMDVKLVGQDDLNKAQQVVHLPVVGEENIIALSRNYTTSPLADFNTANPVSALYPGRQMFIYAIITVILVAGSAYWLEWHSAWFLVIPLYQMFSLRIWYNNYRWYADEETLQIRSGVWGRKFRLLRFVKVQQVRLTQSLYQQRKQLANVLLVTAGGVVTIPYLPLATARGLCNYVLYRIEAQSSDWM